MRRCLDCSALVATGSRCGICQQRATARKNARRAGSAPVARAVKRRDGGCVRCGATLELEAHHRVPVAAGGSHDPRNLVTLCRSCHQAAHRGR